MKRNLILIFILLVVSLSALTIVISKLRKNESTQGTPVGASNLVGPNQVEGKLVDNFPDFPVYPSARIANSNKDIKAAMVIYGAKWTISGDNVIREVENWYVKELSGAGWTKVNSENSGASGVTINFTKPKSSATVDIRRAINDGYKINILVTIKSTQ